MKKILTALANPELNINLKKINEFEIIGDDIQYQDAIFDTLEKNEVDILILSELLKGQNNLKQLIKKIKQIIPNIKIILFLEKENMEKIKIAKEEKIQKIYFHHKVTIEEMISYLKEISIENNLQEEIDNLKKLIIENKKEKNNKLLNLKNIVRDNSLIYNNFLKEKNIINNIKIITIAGTHETGKSLISACLALNLNKTNKKILLLDFDLLNQDIHTIFGIKKIPNKLIKKIKNNYSYEVKNYNEFCIKIKSNLNFISGSNIILQKEKFNINKLEIFFEKIKNNYDYILIDISSECFLEYTKYVLQKSDKIVFLTEGNLLEIKKSINLLDIYLKEWNIEKNKINIVFNKFNKKSIDEKILNNIFFDFNILGKINFNQNYSEMINKNMKNYFLNKKEKKEHEKIINHILLKKNKYIGGKFIWKRLN